MKFKKGQMNIGNYFALLFVFMIAIFFMPVLNTVIEESVNTISGSPNPMITLTISVMRMLPMVLIVGCILTAVYWSIPRNE